jgi:pyruvate formate lyase activating enzyme
LAQQKRKVWLRYVLVPNLTDDEADINETANFAASLGVVERVDVLPFHQLGRHKWQKLDIEYKLSDTPPAPPDLVERVCKQFRAAGLKAY